MPIRFGQIAEYGRVGRSAGGEAVAAQIIPFGVSGVGLRCALLNSRHPVSAITPAS